ncbi:TIGR01777 family oxidoreductase [Crocinitomicaceae bacterium]|nr:TIGR01777 family oxidoreductase [Crocinitomicaceae bacterium]
MKTVLIAGGTGHLGRNIEKELILKGYKVLILTRNPTKENHVFWNPAESKIDTEKLSEIEIIINLAGENIGAKKWSNDRIKALFLSRINPAVILYENRTSFPKLKQYISASGVNCYGYDSLTKIYEETDVYGKDTLSQIVEKWEEAADLFLDKYIVTKMRTAVVLDSKDGAFQKIAQPIKMGIGSPLGSGEQYISWVYIDDLVASYLFAIENEIEGVYNIVGGNDSNKTFGKTLAEKLKKGFWFPKVPAFVLKFILGKMSILVLKGVQISNKKITEKGFKFKFDSLDKVFEELV